MAYPTFTSTVSSTTSDSSSLSYTIPSGLTSGQWLLLIAQMDGNAGSFTTPSGFTALLFSSSLDIGAGVQGQGRIYYKLTDGTETDGTIAITGSTEKGTVHAVLVSGIDSGLVPQANGASGAASDPDPPSLTASGGAIENLWFAYAATSSASNTASAWTDPSGFTAVQNASAPANDTTGIQSRLAYINETTATKNPGTFNITDDSWAAATIVFSPLVVVLEPWWLPVEQPTLPTHLGRKHRFGRGGSHAELFQPSTTVFDEDVTIDRFAPVYDTVLRRHALRPYGGNSLVEVPVLADTVEHGWEFWMAQRQRRFKQANRNVYGTTVVPLTSTSAIVNDIGIIGDMEVWPKYYGKMGVRPKYKGASRTQGGA